jgi:hypothetical protein
MAWTDTITNTTKIRTVHLNEIRAAINDLEAACATHHSSVNTSRNSVCSHDGYNSSNRTTVNTYDSTVNSSRWGWNSSKHGYGVKGPCYLKTHRNRRGFCLFRRRS